MGAKSVLSISLIAVLVIGMISFDDAFAKNDDKITICHIPPGDPNNPQTIEISEKALQTHIQKHGDTLGPCEALVCVPPTCTPSCGENGTCVADDVCVCDTGFYGDLCTIPSCTSNEDCNDGNSCTLDACNDVGQCVAAPIPGCIPDDRCLTNSDCNDSNSCTADFCDSLGQCSNPPLPSGSSCGDDGVFCNGSEVCDGAGTCTSSGDPCSGNSCDETNDVCEVACVPSGDEVCDGIDNDCDGTVDNGFNVGLSCIDGLGECRAGGVLQCNPSGTATVCSAIAGTGSTEICDGLDNDCDGTVDNGVPSPSCSLTQGVCADSVQSCSGTGGFGTCGAAEYGANYESGGELSCDGLDNDCDGAVDEDFDFQSNPFHCGGCGITCASGEFCGSGVCEAFPTPLVCDPGTFDLNLDLSDGCEFTPDANGIYVSEVAGTDSSTCGAYDDTCKTISFGLTRASDVSATTVYVASGFYSETVALINGINLSGGYNPVTWQQNPTTNPTIIQGGSTSTHKNTLVADSITSSTTVDGFIIVGQDNFSTSGNSYAVLIRNSNDQLVLDNNKIFSGIGGLGSSGFNGESGLNGDAGASGPNSFEATGAGSCNSSNDIQLSNSGSRTCSADNVSGGNGGGVACTPVEFTETSGTDGFNGQSGVGTGGGTGGTGGDAGDDARLDNTVCSLPSNFVFGLDGLDGGSGANGLAVLGCSNPSGSVIGGNWIGDSGAVGQSASNGGGAGGGGAGGGSIVFSGSIKDRLGAHGGGGGSGACGGTGGAGSTAGGGSFGIFVTFDSTPSSIPSITNNQIRLGNGGQGGPGGFGGTGGQGGLGGSGGISAIFCSGSAGNGGEGGNGGHGSGGGGGCGGISYGIYASGQGSTSLGSWSSGNTFVTIGSPGNGGTGGLSLGNSGGNGQAGSQANTNFP